MAFSSYALRYGEEELDIETVLEWQFNTELHRRCTSIELASKKINTETAQLLASITLQCRLLHTLILSNNEIRDEGASTLAKVMPWLQQEITHLDLSGNSLTDGAAGELAKAFLSQARPTEGAESADEGASVPVLDLSDNNLKDVGVQLVAAHVRRRVRLRLRGVGCGKQGLIALLEQKRFLVELDVGKNPIGVNGVYHLCREIQSEIHWQMLNISCLQGLSGGPLHSPDSHAASREAANLATPIASCLGNAGLKDLDCSGNALGDNGATEIVEAMKDCDEGVERLAMNHSDCGILTATMLKDVLQARCGACTALRVLELAGNLLNDDCMRVFAKGLAQSFALEILILAGNLITCAGVQSLAEGLKSQRRLMIEGARPVTVVELDLSQNPLGPDSAEALVGVACDVMAQRPEAVDFEVPWGLEKLHLNGCQVATSDDRNGNRSKLRGLHGDLLKLAMSQRAILAKEAAEVLASRPDDQLLQKIKERRLRQPHSLQVFGLFEASDVDLVEFVEPMRRDAEMKLKELWPELPPLPKKTRTAPEVASPEVAPEPLTPSTEGVATKEAASLKPVEPVVLVEPVAPVAPTEELQLPVRPGLSTTPHVEVTRMDDSDEEHSPYAEVDVGDDDVLKLTEREVPLANIHRLDLNDTAGSIRDLDELDRWWEDSSPAKGKALNSGTHSMEKKPTICRNLLPELDPSANVSDTDPSASCSSQEFSGENRSSTKGASPDFSPTSTSSPSSPRDLAQEALVETLMVEFTRSTSMGSGKGVAVPGSHSLALAAPKCSGAGKGPKGPAAKGAPGAPGKGVGRGAKGKTPVLPLANMPNTVPTAEGEQSPFPHKGECHRVESPTVPKKGKGKGKAKGPPTPAPTSSAASVVSDVGSPSDTAMSSSAVSSKAKGPGKGPLKGAPAAKGAKGTPKGATKGEGKAKAKATPRYQGHAPLGRKIHWGAHYEEPHADSVFSDLPQGTFDKELLKALLSNETDKPVMGRRKSVAKRPTGISILDGSRAQNLAIVMSKITQTETSTEEFCQNLKEMNFREEFMSPDDVELLIHVLPTPEENKKLLEYKDRVAELRDVEQNVMPFCVLHKGVVRMKVAKFALSHQGTYSGIKVRCEVLKDAAKQVRKSEEFRQMLSVVLRVGNFINHGVDEEEVKTQEVDGATIRGISVDSLSSLASFKSGTVSTMHFLCLSLGSMNTDFFQGLKESLSSVQEASKEKSALLKGSIESFAKDVETAEKQLNLLLTVDEEAAEFAPSEEKEAELREEMEKWKEESDVLQKIGDEAFNECAVAQKFFSASERKQAELPPVESFFLHIANFLEQFQEAWTEIERNPRKWAEMAPKDEKGHTRFPFLSIRQQRKSLPAAVTHSSSEGGRETSTAESGPSGAVRVRKCASQARVPRQSAPNLAQPNLAQRLSLSGFDVDSTAHKAPATSSKQELEHAGAQEKSQASEQDTLEKEKEAKEVCGSVRRSIYASVAQKMRLESPMLTTRRGSAPP